MNFEIMKIGGNWWGTAWVVLALVLGVYGWTKYGASFRHFCVEVWGELLKCSWPWDPQKRGLTRFKELIDSTVVVVVSAILLAGFVTFSDFILLKVVGFITRLHA